MRTFGSKRVWLSAAVLMIIAALVSASAYAAPVPAPRWIVSSYAAPSNLSPNTSGRTIIYVQAHNVGAASTVGEGKIELTDILPVGVTLIENMSHEFSVPTGRATFGHHETIGCKVKVGAPICTWKQATQGEVPAGGTLAMEIEVKIGAITEGMVTNTAKVTGGYQEGGKEAEVSANSQMMVSSADAPFGLDTFSLGATDSDGLPDAQAGAHPYALTTNLNLSTFLPHHVGPSPQPPDGQVRDLVTDLPLGFLGNPQAVPQCPESDLANHSGATCPAASQVGVFTLRSLGKDGFSTVGGPEVPVYDMEPSGGYPGELGFTVDGQAVVLFATIRPGDYGLRVVAAGLTRALDLTGAELTVWGVPADPSHDGQRAAPGSCGLEPTPTEPDRGFECVFGESFPPALKHRPFLANAADCSDPAGSATLYTDSWHDPARVPLYPEGSPNEAANDFGLADFGEPEWVSRQVVQPPVSGCGALVFDPALSLQPDTSRADSPAGVHVDLEVPQDEEPEGLATPPLKSAVVKLPRGLVVDPSTADGLAGCSEEQAGVGSTLPATCPQASWIGRVTVETPLLEKSLPGEIFLGKPACAPCSPKDAEEGRLIRLYLQIDDPERGVFVKLLGKVTVDPGTGQLTATFAQNPQLPFSNLKVDFTSGPRASLTTPSTCGRYATTSMLTPWSAPETPVATSSWDFAVTQAPDGGPCVSSEAEEPDEPSFEAGSAGLAAGSYTPFVLRLSRRDGSQVFKGLDMTLPPGLVGKLAGIGECSQASIEAAEHNAGVSEQSTASCPASSEIGTVDSGAGSGNGATEAGWETPFHVGGHAYLAGSYKGAPFSIVAVIPAVAGPFDLGTVVVRSALYIDPSTAQVTVKTDPIPTMLDGIPLDVRSIAIDIDRPQFTLNPTSCERFAITGTLFAAFSQAPLSSPFQVQGCQGLPFKPSFTASTSGKTSKANGASLIVKVSQKPGQEANIHKVDLQLPLALPARLTTLQKACTEAQFNANPAGCPEASDIATATAITPLLNVPLTGPAYLVSHGGAAFPDVEFVLQGEGIEIVLDGGTDIKKGITYSRFETVPDAPISSFETVLPQGPHSALAANTNLCAPTKTMTTKKRVTVHVHGHTKHITRTITEQQPEKLIIPTIITGQNNAQRTQNTSLTVTGCPKPTKHPKTKAKKTKKAAKKHR